MAIDKMGQAEKMSVRAALTATGKTQATAFPLVANTSHEFTNVPEGSGARLPVGVLPCEVYIQNSGDNILTIYPPSGGTVNYGEANDFFQLTVGSWADFRASSPTKWYQKEPPEKSAPVFPKSLP